MRYAVGELLVDSLTSLFAGLRDTPLVAWCGPAHYATVGGLVLGTGFGAVMAWATWRGLQRLRQHMAALEENSDEYDTWTSDDWDTNVWYGWYGYWWWPRRCIIRDVPCSDFVEWVLDRLRVEP